MEKLESNIIDLESRRKKNNEKEKKAKEDPKKILFDAIVTSENQDNVIDFPKNNRQRLLEKKFKELGEKYVKYKELVGWLNDQKSEMPKLLKQADALYEETDDLLCEMTCMREEIESERQSLIQEKEEGRMIDARRKKEINRNIAAKDKEIKNLIKAAQRVRNIWNEMKR